LNHFAFPRWGASCLSKLDPKVFDPLIMQASMDSTIATPRDMLLRRDPASAESAMELNRQHAVNRLKLLTTRLRKFIT